MSHSTTVYYTNLHKHISAVKIGLTFVLPTVLVLISNYASQIHSQHVAEQYLTEIQDKKLLGQTYYLQKSELRYQRSQDKLKSELEKSSIKKRLVRNENLVANDPEKRNVLETIFNTDIFTKKCSAKKFVFLKTHRAGSTTLKTMFLEYQAENLFTSTLSANGIGHWLGGWPGPFRSNFYFNRPEETKSLVEKTDIIYDHLRWDWNEIKQVLSDPSNTFRIGVIRDPIKVLKSNYNHFYASQNNNVFFEKRGKLNPGQSFCMGSPFLEVAKFEKTSPFVLRHGKRAKQSDRRKKRDTSKTRNFKNEKPQNYPLSEILRKLRKNPKILKSVPYNFRLNNSQSHDFNYLTPKQISEQFDFVIVLERFQESLLILKRLLCMSWETITPYASNGLSIQKGAGDYSETENTRLTQNLTDIESENCWIKNDCDMNLELVVQNLTNLDQNIYDWADSRLDRLLEIYGVDRAEKEIKNRFSNFCKHRKTRYGPHGKQFQYIVKSDQAWANPREVLRELREYSYGDAWNGACKKLDG